MRPSTKGTSREDFRGMVQGVRQAAPSPARQQKWAVLGQSTSHPMKISSSSAPRTDLRFWRKHLLRRSGKDGRESSTTAFASASRPGRGFDSRYRPRMRSGPRSSRKRFTFSTPATELPQPRNIKPPRLKHAFKLGPDLRAVALDDADLEPLWVPSTNYSARRPLQTRPADRSHAQETYHRFHTHP